VGWRVVGIQELHPDRINPGALWGVPRSPCSHGPNRRMSAYVLVAVAGRGVG
jgi:hypothetical protein